MNAWNPTLFCDFCDPPYDLSIGIGCRIVFALPDLIGFGTMRPLRRPVTRQSSGCKRAIWDHSDFLFATERQHLPLLSSFMPNKYGIFPPGTFFHSKKSSAGTRQRRFPNACRYEGAVSMVSTLALMVLYAIFGSLASSESDPTATCPKSAAWFSDGVGSREHPPLEQCSN
jgi:hypothetical protein